MITPSIIFLTLWIDFEKINQNINSYYNQKFGSLFEEFKCNQNLLQMGFYSIFTLWNVIYSVNQLFTTKSEYLQRGLNLIISIFMMMYLVMIWPFKEKAILISNLASWAFNCFLFLIIFLRSFVESFNQNEYFDFVFIGIVTIQILFQYGVSLILFIIQIKELYLKYKGRNQPIISKENREF